MEIQDLKILVGIVLASDAPGEALAGGLRQRNLTYHGFVKALADALEQNPSQLT
jgi:hypothetical protein